MGKCVAVMCSRSVNCLLFAIINILFNIIIIVVMKLRNVTDLLPSFCLLGISDYVCMHFVYIKFTEHISKRSSHHFVCKS
jgi:hypothetical protein